MKNPLHPQLAHDSVPVIRLRLCQVLLARDARYFWAILVPDLPDLREIHQLEEADQALLMREICQVSEAVESLDRPDKINVAALGNLVPQLHIHVVARHRGDAAWPGPIWGQGEAEAYGADALEARRTALLNVLSGA